MSLKIWTMASDKTSTYCRPTCMPGINMYFRWSPSFPMGQLTCRRLYRSRLLERRRWSRTWIHTWHGRLRDGMSWCWLEGPDGRSMKQLWERLCNQRSLWSSWYHTRGRTRLELANKHCFSRQRITSWFHESTSQKVSKLEKQRLKTHTRAETAPVNLPLWSRQRGTSLATKSSAFKPTEKATWDKRP